MITIKTKKEIELMKKGGKFLSRILKEIGLMVKPGIKIIDLDREAERLIEKVGGSPSFKNYRVKKTDRSFPTALCASVNEEVVHAPAGERILKEGDIIGLDLGMRYPAQRGLYTDMAITVGVGEITKEAQNLINITKEALELGIQQIKQGNYISYISRAIQEYVEKNGYSVVRSLVGHGVGFSVHEEPMIPNFVDKKFKEIELEEGMTLALEPMVNMGGSRVKILNDGWTVATEDNSLSAHFEHTVAVKKEGCDVLTD